ncbi:hypothetical protein QVD17_30241 [Tagetes erecta]|uniref:Uncharacterized protein n=1 Tax=Tagetes erecta TaxID=13708 RepID=A0AAD8NFV1_TARER|nr:hypothetical protein QVD17_30241 [Tagetes erecta]
MDHSDQTKRPFSSSPSSHLHLHRSTASSSRCFIISLLHHLLPPRTSIYCFIIFFHQEHRSTASSPSSAVVGISDLVRFVAYGGCSHCMLLTYRKKRWIASIKPTGSMKRTCYAQSSQIKEDCLDQFLGLLHFQVHHNAFISKFIEIQEDAGYDKNVLDSVPSGSSGVVVSASVGDDMG